MNSQHMPFHFTLEQLLCYHLLFSVTDVPLPTVNVDIQQKNTNKGVDYIFVFFILDCLTYGIILTLSDPAFSVILRAGGGGGLRGLDVKNQR